MKHERIVMVLLVIILLLNAGMAIVYSTDVDDYAEEDHTHPEIIKEGENANVKDLIAEGKIKGDGNEIHNLNASYITTGIINKSLLPDDIYPEIPDGLNPNDFAMAAHSHDTRYYQKSEIDSNFLRLSGGTLTGDLYLPNLYASGIITGHGDRLTDLNASRITNGTLDNARLPNNIDAYTFRSYKPNDFAMIAHTHDERYLRLNGGTLSGNLTLENLIANGIISGDGSGITNLNANNIANGVINNLRLPANINADTLDTLDSSNFALMGHKHDSSDIYASVPIGTIIPWAKNLIGVPSLPAGWVECNGQTLIDATSPLNNAIIPNLNGENRYLRGNYTSGDIGGNSTHNHQWGNKTSVYSNALAAWSGMSGTNSYDSNGNLKKFEVSTGSNEHLLGDYYTDLESNEPPFYNVVYIIKIK